MLRLSLRSSPLPQRVLEQDEIIHQLEWLAMQALASVPPVPVTVERFHERTQVICRAYCASEFSTRLRQLRAEREIASPSAGRTPARDATKDSR